MEIQFTLPESWQEISLKQYQQLNFNDTASVIAGLSQVEVEHVLNFTDEQLNVVLADLKYLQDLPHPILVDEIKGFKRRDNLLSLTAEELLMIEELCQDFQSNADLVLGFVYPYKEEMNLNELKNHATNFHDIDCQIMFGTVLYYLSTAGFLTMKTMVETKKIELKNENKIEVNG